ncbi:uncharacterized protein CLAFUR5_08079 [Fulvia fulva]|uniref:Beta-lactamase-related domain-containing protein n=1 Tax=Passalora fulva TaxID=5499 RepID=A0A9Q8P6V8_PASFU|nr:uncharacterized protein CLAFUR5_08079 [Fulvia fulva]KAK4630717.1 hypothetical protein CLAFUR0_07959 [Fulvia fulva]UJO15242.1 hypothetical protein CLAFUR5_08079 [Fulvia fulva]
MDVFVSATFDQRAKDLMLEWHVPGMSLAVVTGDDVASKGFRHASIKPSKPCTPDTIFDIASCSKSLTAASVALLIADNDHFKDITIEDVLSHRTGLPSHDSSYVGIKAEHPDLAKSVTRNLRNLEINGDQR